jgi:glycine cleavage system regulatory protein
MAGLQAAVEDLNARTHEDAEKKFMAFQEELLTDLRARSTQTQTKFQAWQAEMEKRTAGFEADIMQRTASAAESVQMLREVLRGDVEKAKKDASSSLEKDLGDVRELMETGTRKMRDEIEVRLGQMNREIEAGRTDLAAMFESSRAEIAAWEEGAKKHLADAERANVGTLSSLTSRVEADKAALAKSIETVESRLADYQGDVDYRMKVLDEANRDMDALRASLSQTMDKMGAAVRTEMKDLTDALSSELTTGWKSEVAGAEAVRRQLTSSMGELQAELEVLKTRAYQDAEKKLSMFEEEFFAPVPL